MITADYHLHTNFSSDSDTLMEAMVERAIALGLTQICFTDHMDYDFPKKYELPFQFDVAAYFQKIEEMQHIYGNQIKILKGIELGLKPNIVPELTKLLNEYSFDYVIGSSHLVDNIDPYYPEFWENKTEEEGIVKYFQSILKNISAFSGFDTYGHIDYIVRYAPNKNHDFSYEKYADILDEVLKTIISAGKAIEVNTAGYKYGLGHPNPREDIITRYFELGGKYVTIGSDGHKPEHMAYDFSKAREMLLSLGIKEYAVFENRTAKLLPL